MGRTRCPAGMREKWSPSRHVGWRVLNGKEVRRTVAQYLAARRIASDIQGRAARAAWYTKVAVHLPVLRLHIEQADGERKWIRRTPTFILINMKLNDEHGDASSKCIAPLLNRTSRRSGAALTLALVLGVFNHRVCTRKLQEKLATLLDLGPGAGHQGGQARAAILQTTAGVLKRLPESQIWTDAFNKRQHSGSS